MSMTKSEVAGATLGLAPGARVGIIAGGGSLPVEVAAGLARKGHPPFIILIEGEVDRKADFADYEQENLALEDIGSLLSVLRRRHISYLVLAGEIRRRPEQPMPLTTTKFSRAIPSSGKTDCTAERMA
jgi:DUF1009 family protein